MGSRLLRSTSVRVVRSDWWPSVCLSTMRLHGRVHGMHIESIRLRNYLSVQDVSLRLSRLNVLIGANASGKSNLINALSFLRDALQHDYGFAIGVRGGFVHLACKASRARRVHIAANFKDTDWSFKWSVELSKDGVGYSIREEVHRLREDEPPQQILSSRRGEGWWWSGEQGRVQLSEQGHRCALAAAAADATFPARAVAAFVRGWGFFDPNPGTLRRTSLVGESPALGSYGQNLAARLHTLRETDPERFERVHSATRDILGVPERIEFRTSDDDDRVALLLTERGLKYRIYQTGCSNGTLRMLAIVTALLGTPEATLIGIEEPENYIHPGALAAFTEHVLRSNGEAQLVLTTHSPHLLDVLDTPEAVILVRRSVDEGTKVTREPYPGRVRDALEASGFGLGEWHETRGFGG